MLDLRDTNNLDLTDTLVSKKVASMYRDLEANLMGGITNRQYVMLAVNLVYHSPLAYYFQGEMVEKGPAELLIIGDTRVGKSAVTKKFHEFFQGRGEFIQGEAVTLAGLLAGVDESVGSRFVRIGRLPMFHRRIVTIDEANELSTEITSQLSGVRSSGLFDLIKISTKRIPCLVRIIWVANSKTDKQVTEYNYGVEAVRDFFERPEDIARLDLAICLTQQDVNRESLYITQEKRSKVPHKFTSEWCCKVLDWGWSRKPEQWLLPAETEQEVLRWCKVLSRKYDDGIPLIVESESRIQISRMACSLACSLFSHDGSYENVLVKPEHVEYIGNFIQLCFDAPSMAYGEWSKVQKSGGVEDEGRVKGVCRALGKDGINVILENKITKEEFSRIFNDRGDGELCYSIMMLARMIKRGRYGVELTPPARKYLKRASKSVDYQGSPDSLSLRVAAGKMEESELFDQSSGSEEIVDKELGW